ncbi:MAG: hypothetical protein AMXMBFR64_42790 [Myxococcales bacterium]
MRTLVMDFDGTMVTEDVGDALCERLADPSWRVWDQAWERGEMPLHEAQERMWATLHATPEQLGAAVDAIARRRHGLDAFLADARRGFDRLVLASGGFDWYIERTLGETLSLFDEIWCNTLVPAEGGVQVGFPHLSSLGCGLCAVCKGIVCGRQQGQVSFVGDGTSDRCAVGRAHRMAAVRGSRLAAGCRAAGVGAIEFDSFDDLRPWLTP